MSLYYTISGLVQKNPNCEIKLTMYYKGYLIITANIKQILGMKTYNKTEGM